jgi:hypothetical protein
VLAPAAQLAVDFPELLRDVLDLALEHAGHPPLPDITGLTEESDLAVRRTRAGVEIAIVNHAAQAQRVDVSVRGARGTWTDGSDGAPLRAEAHGRLAVTVPPYGIRLLHFREQRPTARGTEPPSAGKVAP